MTLSAMLRFEFGSQFEYAVDDLPRHATLRYATRPLTAIDRIVLHHTAVSRATTWEAVARYHVDSNGWPGIAYHIAARQYNAQVVVSLLNLPETASYHAHTEGNAHGLAVVLAGDYTTATPTVQEVDAMRRIVAVVREWATWAERLPVVGHGQVPGNDTSCPGAGMAATLALLNVPPVVLDAPLRLAVWEAAKGAQAVSPNPGSAIELLMMEQGYFPIGQEVDVVLAGEWRGVAQLGYCPGYNAEGVAFYGTNQGPGGQWQAWMVEKAQ